MSYAKLKTTEEEEDGTDQVELQVLHLRDDDDLSVKSENDKPDNLEDSEEDSIPNFELQPSLKKSGEFSFVQALKNRIGLCYAIIAALLFSVMNLMVKLSSEELPSFEMVFIRSFFGLIGCLIYLGIKKVYIFGPKEKRRLLFLRGCFGFIGLSCNYYSITVLPLSDAITLSFFNPVFTALLARIILKEKWGIIDFICTLLSIAGVVLVARPEFIFHSKVDDINTFSRIVAVIVALFGAFSAALAYVTVRSVGSGVNPFVLVLYFSTISSILSIPFLFGIPSQREKFSIPPLSLVPILLGLSLSAFFGQGLLNRGLQIEKAGRASAMNYLQIVFSLLSELLFLNTVPEWTSIVGACLVMASSITNFVKK